MPDHKKKKLGTMLKTSPLKKYKKQVKRMKHRLNPPGAGPHIMDEQQAEKYKTRLAGAEEHLRNYDKEQEQKKIEAMKAAATKK